MNTVLTEHDLWQLVERERATAHAMVDDRMHCSKAWNCAGLAVEFALKAVIIKSQRFNCWPSRSARPDLYTHDLRVLMQAAGIDTKTVPSNIRTSLRTVMDWSREADYNSGRMPRAVARGMVQSAFGDGQVVAWLQTL